MRLHLHASKRFPFFSHFISFQRFDVNMYIYMPFPSTNQHAAVFRICNKKRKKMINNNNIINRYFLSHQSICVKERKQQHIDVWKLFPITCHF